MNKLDEIFKEKLSDHTVAPSAATWQRVESGLSKKNKTVVWLRWAAVFLLGGLLVSTLWLPRQDSSPVAKLKENVKQENEIEIKKSISTVLAEQNAETKNVLPKKSKNSVAQHAIQQASVAKEEVAQAVEVQSPVPIQSVETPAAEVTKLSSQVSKGIVLTYTLGPVEMPIEAETQSMEVAASSKKDKSLKRMVDFARTVKNSDPLGEIRVMKEDLFALDLRNKTTSKNH